jgi:hypothetical protein
LDERPVSSSGSACPAAARAKTFLACCACRSRSASRIFRTGTRFSLARANSLLSGGRLRGEPRSRDSTETRNGYSYRTLRSGGLAALCSQSFGDALQRTARYKQIDLSGRDPDHPAPATRRPSSLTGCWRAIPVSAVLLELRFSWILSICRSRHTDFASTTQARL